MDLLRAAIKAMYYDYPIENAYGMIIREENRSSFLSHFNRLACGEDDGFSQREMAAYKDYIYKELRNCRPKSTNYFQDTVALPLMFAREVLTKDKDDYPCVDFSCLFRWREVVKCMGEDLFTTAYLAKNDALPRTDFFWPNVISHNHEELNKVLDNGLSDIHSHFGGAIDSFQFNWICLMNDVGALHDKFKLLKESFNEVVVFDKEYAFQNLSSWCRVAAAIRVILYKAFVKGQRLNQQGEKIALKEIINSGSEELTKLAETIDTLRADAKKTREGLIVDYAISEELVTDEFAVSPYCIYAGERQIEYAFFREFHKETSSVVKGEWIELFYLYELIKMHLRKEFVFANEMSGLDNYIGFAARSPIFYKYLQPVCNMFSMQTSIRQGKDDHIESRVTTNALGLTAGDYWKGLFTDDPFLEEEEMKARLTFLAQLSKGVRGKKEHDGGRCLRKRNDVHSEYIKVTHFIGNKQNAYDIVGLDVGGLEFYYRPEVFGHVLRAGKKDGLKITYHVGEEFYDLADGLRAIWEILEYAQIGGNDRLGHCLALGVMPREYYKRKHCTLTMPRQVLLDNAVWMCCFAKEHRILMKPELKTRLEETAQKLYSELGYDRYEKILNMADYYESMSLRSDEANEEDGLDTWSVTAELNSKRASKARANAQAQMLHQAYMLDETLIEEGEKPTTVRFDNDYVKLVIKIQRSMIKLVNKTEVCIESCPSSNLQIGNLGRYDYHPSVMYYLNPRSKNKKLNVAVCTDDKGTFSTSLANEFSLLALAATKEKGWKKGMEKEIERLIMQGNKYRFVK